MNERPYAGRKAVQMSKVEKVEKVEESESRGLDDALSALLAWRGRAVRVTEFAGVDVLTDTYRVRGVFRPRIQRAVDLGVDPLDDEEDALVLAVTTVDACPRMQLWMLEDCLLGVVGDPECGPLTVRGKYGRLVVELVPGSDRREMAS